MPAPIVWGNALLMGREMNGEESPPLKTSLHQTSLVVAMTPWISCQYEAIAHMHFFALLPSRAKGLLFAKALANWRFGLCLFPEMHEKIWMQIAFTEWYT